MEVSLNSFKEYTEIPQKPYSKRASPIDPAPALTRKILLTDVPDYRL
jgi:hypothetical protein